MQKGKLVWMAIIRGETILWQFLMTLLALQL
jgi:hypothetical protein